MKGKEEKQKIWVFLLLLALAAYTVKNLFVGADVDEGYGIMLGYRLAKGDRLMLEMWEPHQTSAIFTALFIRPFLWLTGGSNDFLNLYLRAIYFAVQGAIAVYGERTLRRCVPDMGKGEAALLAMVFYVTSPKCIYVPEYSNLHVWFFAMLCFSLMRFSCPASPEKGKTGQLLAAGVFLACDVLAYPSMAILFPVCILFLWRKEWNRAWRACAMFSLPCFLGAAAFVGYIFSYMTMQQVQQVLPYILEEGSHQTAYLEKMLTWLGNFGKMGMALGACGACALLLAAAWWKLFEEKRESGSFTLCFMASFFLTLLSYQLYCWIASDSNASYPQLLHVVICLGGVWAYWRVRKEERAGFCLILFSLVSYFAVMLLSNWGPAYLNPYLYMGTIGGLLCLRRYLQEHSLGGWSRFWRLACFLLVVGNAFGYCYLIIGGEQIHSSIFTVRGIGREGLRKGIFTSYMTSYEYNTNQEVWPEAVPDGSTVLYVGPSQFLYMLGDCKVASPNTISTFAYDESVVEYWKLNPDRYPDVVVVESWFGENRVFEQESFIVQWLENEFQASEVLDYPYITVYRK